MPVSNKKRKNGKVVSRNLSVARMEQRENGVLALMLLLNRAVPNFKVDANAFYSLMAKHNL